MPARVLLIAGEASGDLHGSGVVRELRALIKQLARPPAGPVPPGLAPGTP